MRPDNNEGSGPAAAPEPVAAPPPRRRGRRDRLSALLTALLTGLLIGLLRTWLWRLGVGAVAAVGTYASIVAQLDGPLTSTQARWTLLASLIAGLLAMATTAVGGVMLSERREARFAARGPADPPPWRPDPGEVVVSFVAADRGWADWLCHELARAGYRVRPHTADTLAADHGERIDEQARRLMGSAGAIAVIVSGAALAGHPGTTWVEALARAAHPDPSRVIVVSVDGAGQPGDDQRAAGAPGGGAVEVGGLDRQAARDRLLAAVSALGLTAGAGAGRPGAGEAPEEVDYPGHGPAISNIPHRNPHFTGRGNLLTRLHRGLIADGGTVLTQGRALHGLGGVGKTQLALEYAHRYGAHYTLTWWVPAEQPAGIVDALGWLARTLGLPEVANQQEMLAALWAELRRRERWLLIFDNAEDSGVLEAYWPPAGGHVLVTSRSGNWANLVPDKLRVEPLGRQEAVTLLRRRSSDADDRSAGRLADELGGLPLALAQAAAYVEETRTSLADYRRLLRHRQRDLLSLGKPADYPSTVATTWSMSLSKAEEKTPGARDLLALCAFLAPDDIPRGLPGQYPEALPGRLAGVVSERVSYDMTVMALASYSLLSADAERLGSHRLVQAMVRHGLGPAERRRWAEAALRLVEHAFPPNPMDTARWPACGRLLPHGLVASAHAESLGVAAAETGRLLQRAGVYAHWRGQYGQARELFGRALTLRERMLGPDHLDLAETLTSRARLDFHRARLGEAREAAERALAIRERALGHDHPLVGENLADLGRVTREFSDLDRAWALMTRALAIAERYHGPSHPRVATYRDYLGTVLWRQGRLGASRQAHEEALAARRAIHGPGHPEVGSSLKHLGLVLRDLCRYDLAQECFADGVGIMASVFGADHPETLDVVVYLADLRRILGEPREAQNLLERVAAAHRARLGEHPDVAGALVKLGAALRDVGELRRARAELSRAHEIYVRVYGPRHPYLAESLLQLGPTMHLLGESETGRRLLERARSVFEEAYGPHHPAAAEALEYLAPLLADLGDHERAEALSAEARRTRIRLAGDSL